MMKCACCGREGNETPCLECQVELAERHTERARNRIKVLERRIKKKNKKIRELEAWKALRPE